MKNIKNRSIVLYFLMICFFAGVGFFVYDFAMNSRQWALSSINRHVSEGSMSGGKIMDANGVVLAQTVDGKRVYNEDEGIRKAMLHTVGDGSVLISSSIQSRYSTELFGYNIITGFGAPDIVNMSQNIALTLDSKICSTASKAFGDKKGAALVYNYLTGEVICMVSLPTYDVNKRPDIAGDKTDKYEGVYLNRALSCSFTPGSILKIFTTAAALDLMSDAETRAFKCEKTKIYDGEKVACMSNHGKINLLNAFSKSCDIVFGDIAVELGKEKMTQKMQEYGFNKQYILDGMPLTVSQYDVETASKGDLAWSGIGQYKDLANSMHMLITMGAIANGGVPVMPYEIKSISSDAAFPATNNVGSAGKRMFNLEIAEKLKEIMRYTMKNQYGDYMFPGMQMCAKTGTGETGEDKLPHGWMIGFSYDKKFPVAFVVVVENGDFGVKSAGPIASTIMKDVYSKFKNNK